jgi:hypothetical protein
MEITIQHDIYISANYSVSSYLNFIPISLGLIPGPIWKMSCNNLLLFTFRQLKVKTTWKNERDFQILCVQGRYGKFHVIIFLSHILHWPFPSIDFYIAKKILELTNCKNKSLRELTLFNLQIFLFRVWFQKHTKQCRSVKWR